MVLAACAFSGANLLSHPLFPPHTHQRRLNVKVEIGNPVGMLEEDTTQRERELSTQVPHGRGARLGLLSDRDMEFQRWGSLGHLADSFTW